MFETAEPLHQSLGIVETVDGKDDLFVSEVAADGVADGLYFGIGCGLMKFIVVDADREQIDPNKTVLILKIVKIVIYSQQHFYGQQEMLYIVVGMEADQIGAHDAME